MRFGGNWGQSEGVPQTIPAAQSPDYDPPTGVDPKTGMFTYGSSKPIESEIAELQKAVDPFYSTLEKTGKLTNLGFKPLGELTDPFQKKQALSGLQSLQKYVTGGGKLYTKEQLNPLFSKLPAWQQDLLGYKTDDAFIPGASGAYGNYYAFDPKSAGETLKKQIQERYYRPLSLGHMTALDQTIQKAPALQSFFKERPLTEREQSLISSGVLKREDLGPGKLWSLPYDVYYNLKNNPSYSSQSLIDKYVVDANSALQKAGIVVPKTLGAAGKRFTMSGPLDPYRVNYDTTTGSIGTSSWLGSLDASSRALLERQYPQLTQVEDVYQNKVVSPLAQLVGFLKPNKDTFDIYDLVS